MNTRSAKGLTIQKPDRYSECQLPRQTRHRNPLNSLKPDINYEIFKQLIKKLNRIRVKVINIPITETMALYLKSRHQVTGRFARNAELFQELAFDQVRAYTTEISHNGLDEEFVKFRVAKRKQVAFRDRNQNKITLACSRPIYFSIRFGILERID